MMFIAGEVAMRMMSWWDIARSALGRRRAVRVRTRERSSELHELERLACERGCAHALFTHMVEQSPAAILALDGSDSVLLANNEARRLLGSAPSGCPDDAGLMDRFAHWRCEEGADGINPLDQLRRSGTLKNVRFRSESAGEIARTYLVTGAALNGGGEATDGSVFVFQEWTDRAEIEDRLRESERRFHQLFMELPEGYALHELVRDETGRAVDYRFLMVNPAFERLKGLRAGELVGRTVKGVLPGTEPWIERYAAVAETGEPARFEEYSAELERYYEVHAYRPQKDRFAVIFSDITARRQAEQERRRLEQQMLQAQKLESLGVLAGGIAHDFNNLLMAVLGNADLALAMLPQEAEAREYVRDIELASRRAADLCRQLLAYAGRGRMVIERVDLHRLIEDMTRILNVSISKKAVLKFNVADNVPRVEGDASQLQQVVMNLITNASEAVGEKSGVISISLGAMQCDADYLEGTFVSEGLEPGLYVYVEVADTGCGMDAETMRRIFDPFFTTKFTGRGLGLAAVLGIARSHQGAIKVYSEPGRGTTFKVLLPTHVQEMGPALPTSTSAFSLPEALRDKMVLLADDEDTVRDVGRKMLEHVGVGVLTARDGQEALEVFEKERARIFCVILDLAMPHMDGEEAFRELRRRSADVPVILSSGYSEQDVLDRFAGKGLAAFLKKPYRISELLTALASVIGSEERAPSAS